MATALQVSDKGRRPSSAQLLDLHRRAAADYEIYRDVPLRQRLDFQPEPAVVGVKFALRVDADHQKSGGPLLLLPGQRRDQRLPRGNLPLPGRDLGEPRGKIVHRPLDYLFGGGSGSSALGGGGSSSNLRGDGGAPTVDSAGPWRPACHPPPRAW